MASTKVWIRTSTLDEASGVGAGGSGGWGWVLGSLHSGTIETSATAPAVVVVEDASSSFNEQQIEIPPELIFSTPSAGGAKKNVPKFGGFGTKPGGSTTFGANAKKPASAAAAKTPAKPAAPIPNIVLANPTDLMDAAADADDGDAFVKLNDLQALTHLHEPSVVHTLKARYARDEIYTSTGSNILVALNPFKATGLYEDEVVDRYASRGELNQSLIGTGASAGDDLPPHVFRIADLAFRTMMSTVRTNAGVGVVDINVDYESTEKVVTNQSLLVSGESGAGKTVTTKHVMRYLASLSKRRGQKIMTAGAGGMARRPSQLRNLVKAPLTHVELGCRPSLASQQSMRRPSVMRGRPGLMDKQASWMRGAEVEEKILEANPILEAFGNARTLRNDNSSRFGKYIELQFKTTGSLIGASIETYLLEKVRLVHSQKGERNYHIFYELMQGASTEELIEYRLSGYDVEDFKLMNQSGTYDRRDGVDDQNEFDDLIDSMGTLNFDETHIKNIMRVTVACMHGLNMSFVEPDPDSSDLDDSDPHLEPFLTVLGVERDMLRDAVCSYEINVGREVARRVQSKANAENSFEALIKAVYSSMFSHLVEHINERITYVPPPGSKKEGEKAASIGILDIFGFEVFKINSFEQLCINYCNETLQQQFNLVVFKSQKELYDREGIDSSFIEFPDNQDALDLIGKKGASILSALDDMTFAPQMNDNKFARYLYQHFDQHPTDRFMASPLQRGKRLFVITHYAGPVEYSADAFVEKNKEEIPRETVRLLESSCNSFVRSLAKWLGSNETPSNVKSSGRGKKKRNTVGSLFSAQLQQLRTKISSTTPYFIRCLKPNQELTENNYTPEVVVDQLKSMGVLEAVRVSRLGFSKSFPLIQFVRRYRLLAWVKLRQSGKSDDELCKIIAEEAVPQLMNLGDEAGLVGIQIGTSLVFLRPRHSDSMESLRYKKIVDAVLVIQCTARVARARSIFVMKQKDPHIIKIQAQARVFLARLDFQVLLLQTVSVTLIQAVQRGAAQRIKYRVVLEKKREEERLAREAEEKKREKERLAKEAEEKKILEVKEAAEKKMREEGAKSKAAEEKKREEERLAKEAEEKKREEERLAKEAEEKKNEEEQLAKEAEEEKILEEKEGAALTLATTENTAHRSNEQDSIVMDSNTRELHGRELQDAGRRSPTTLGSVKRGVQNRRHRSMMSKMTSKVSLKKAREVLSSRKLSTSTSLPLEETGNQAAKSISGGDVVTVKSTSSRALGLSKAGIYKVVLPVTEYGLMINITQFHGSVAFASYRSNPDGSPGEAQKSSSIRGVGDSLVSVNDESCDGKAFGEVVGMLVKASANDGSFCELVLQEWVHAYSGSKE